MQNMSGTESKVSQLLSKIRYLLKKEGKRPEGLSGTTRFLRKPSGRCVLIP
jgi:hypothetical protein